MTMQDEIFQQMLRFVQVFLHVPIRYTYNPPTTFAWSAEIVVEACPFCTLPNGCGVWYGMWSGLADWMTHRPHPKLGVRNRAHVTRPTDNWHHVRFTDLSA